jgi:serine phosphatase RsbU (regulator of sigma subunit)/Tfp pilus assembly protein PilF
MKIGKIILVMMLPAWAAGVFGQGMLPERIIADAINGKADTSQVNVLIGICDSIFRTKPDDAIRIGSEALAIAQRLKFKKGEAYARKYVGMGYFVKGDYVKAVNNFQQALENFEAIGFTPGIANMYNSLGVIYNNTGDDSHALDLYMKSLKLSEEINDSVRVVTAMINIGLIYSKKSNTKAKAEEYYLKALSLGKKLAYQDAIGTVSVNLGELYFEKGDYAAALNYFEQSLKAYQKSHSGNIPYTLQYIGKVYARRNDFPNAIRYQEEAFALAKERNAKLEMAQALLGLATTYQLMGENRVALDKFRQAETITKELGALYELRTIYEGMAQVYSNLNDFKDAYKYQARVSELKDSIFSEASMLQINQLQIQFEIGNMLKENEILKRDVKLREARNKQQVIVIGFLVLGFFSILIFSLLLFRANRHKKKANTELEKKNKLITAQKQEITASIRYASTIQNALLMPRTQISHFLPENFILFRPRDIVSGDFYWFSNIDNRTICIAADCTGHGVPGAFMSMLGIAFLNEIVSSNPEIAANEILNEMRRHIEHALRQSGGSGESKDGMDVALIIFDHEKKQIEFAGANNPLILIRDKELIEYKPDKMPIGFRDTEEAFTNHIIQVEKGDMLYVFSDGYRDQFGGPDGKRFMIRNFRNLLLEVHEKEPEIQKLILEETLDKWIEKTEQIDDILVIGIRIQDL